MSVNRIYHTWVKRIKQLRSKERISRVRNMAWLITGIYQSQSVHLSKIGNKMQGRACLSSHIQRLSRFLDNKAIRVRDWYRPIAENLIRRVVTAGQEVRLVVDGSKVGFGHQLLMVAICYRRRTIPLAWTWVKGQRGHSSARKQVALLSYVHCLIPVGSQVLVVGDTEFGSNEVLKQLDQWHWGYVLRQHPNWLVQSSSTAPWQRLDSLLGKAGQRLWLPASRLTQKYAYQGNILAYWQAGEKTPWFLATNLPTPTLALRAYRRRMWIEEMFGDFKGHGFDLETTHLRHFLRLSRLTLAVSLLYVWLVAFGSRVIKRGQRHLVDRTDRRHFSIFRIGFNMLERCLSNALPFNISFDPIL